MEWRKGQLEAASAVVDALRGDTQTVILSAPTGSGKSLLLAHAIKELGLRTFYTTPQVTLVKQIQDDPLFREACPEAITIVGRNGWTCHRDGFTPVSQAICYELAANGQPEKDENGRPIPCTYKAWNADADTKQVIDWPACPYYRRKAEGELAPCLVTTLAYFLVATASGQRSVPAYGWDRGRLSGRELLIVDEAHGLADAAVQHVSQNWRLDTYDALGWTGAFEGFTASPGFSTLAASEPEMPEPSKAPILQSFLDRLVRVQAHMNVVTDSDIRTSEKLEWDIEVLTGAIEDVAAGIPWIVKAEGGTNPSLSLQPVLVHGQLARRVWNRGNKYVLSSATILDPRFYLDELGLDPSKAEIVEVPSDFPPGNCPVILDPVTTFTYKNREAALPAVADKLWETMREETGRGLVHTVSFVNAEMLYRMAPDELRPRLLLHNRTDRNGTVKEFLSSRAGTVLLSPSLTEGLDLYGDRGEWAFFIKCPYLSVGDERVKRRLKMDDGMRWLELQAIVDTIQGHGRVTRSNTDKSRTYIVDQKHVDALRRWWRYLPMWFQARIIEGQRYAEH
jgi:Rad3-related DNA helicase